jgi:hypothetical protein
MEPGDATPGYIEPCDFAPGNIEPAVTPLLHSHEPGSRQASLSRLGTLVPQGLQEVLFAW